MEKSASRRLAALATLTALASLLTAAVNGAPVRYAVITFLEPSDSDSELESAAADRDVFDSDQVVVVPLEHLEAVHMDEAQDKAEEEKEDGDPWETLSNWLGLGEAGSSPKPDGEEESPFGIFSNLEPSRRVAVVRVGRALRALPADSLAEVRESRVLEEDGIASDDVEQVDLLDGSRVRRALSLVLRQPRQDSEGVPQGREGEAPAPPAQGSFMETVQNQLPGQLQGLGGAMEDSKMIVGTFQAIIMPGSAATDMGQQIQGFISNMPQIPQVPGVGG